MSELPENSLERTDEQLAVEKRRAAIYTNPDYARDSIEVARRALVDAYNDKDTVGVRAALAELSMSSYGVKAAKQTVAAFEGGEESDEDTTMTAEDRSMFAAGINDNLAAFEVKDAAVSKWAGRAFGQEDSNGVDISKMGAPKGADYADLSVELLASQNADAARVAVGEGGITPERAREIINSDAQYQLTAETRQIYMDHAEKAAATV